MQRLDHRSRRRRGREERDVRRRGDASAPDAREDERDEHGGLRWAKVVLFVAIRATSLPLGARLARSSSSTATRTGRSSCSARQTASQIGMSTPWCADSARAARAAVTPSATWPEFGEDGGQPLALGERQTDAPVARQIAGAGEHQVAQAGQAHQRLALSAERRAAARFRPGRA